MLAFLNDVAGWQRPGAAMRIWRGRVQTGVWVLRHPGTGRMVTLVGTMHIGDTRYFGRLSALLGDLAGTGAEIHLEGIAHRDDDGLSAPERRRITAARSWGHSGSAGTAAVLRVESQSAGLRLPEGTRNVDLSHAELLRLIGWREYCRLFRPPRAGTPQLSGAAARAAIRFQLRYHRPIEALRVLSPRRRRVNRVIIDERNAVAFAGATEALAQRNVVLVWGCDHLPGLARLFGGAGYRIRGRRWIDACGI